MTFLRSLAFNLFFFASGAVILTAGIPVLILPRRFSAEAGYVWFGVTLWALRTICGITYEVRGRENLPDEPCIYAVKHQSTWDTIAFFKICRNASYVVKRELAWVPVYGWLMSRTGMVPVDRAAGAKALRSMVRLARTRIAEGRPIAIFPEGTRVALGEEHPYHPGVAALYRNLGVSVVPVALNSGLFWPRRAFVKHPGHIIMEALPPIPPGLPRDRFIQELRERIEGATARLCAAQGK
jgi:1-acyl-sn-glycerol-3-phosphate acyltransferase